MFTGLERIAEELMGRRKWHQYQDILAKNYLLEEELMNRREWVPVKTCNSCDVNTDLSVADHSPAELVIIMQIHIIIPANVINHLIITAKLYGVFFYIFLGGSRRGW